MLSQTRLDRVKKQAKNLLKFARTQQGIFTIHNLAEAQSLLAKINGYSDWHHLEQNITNEHSMLKAESFSFIKKTAQFLSNTTLKHNFYQENDFIFSFLELSHFHLNTDNIQDFLNLLYSYQNMIPIHFDISFLIEFKTVEQAGFFNSLTLSQDTLEQFSLFPQEKRRELRIMVIVKTRQKYREELTDFTQVLLTNNSYFDIEQHEILNDTEINYYTNDFSQFLTQDSGVYAPSEYSFKNIKTGDSLLSWFNVLSVLCQTESDWIINFHVAQAKVTLYSHESVKKELLNISHDFFNLPVTPIATALNPSPWSDSSGLIYRSFDEQVVPFQPCAASQTTYITLVEGKESEYFTSDFITRTICLPLNGAQRAKELPHYFLQVGGSDLSENLTRIKKFLPVQFHNEIQEIHIDSNSGINFFETPMGIKAPLQKHYFYLKNWLFQILSDANPFIDRKKTDYLIEQFISRLYLNKQSDPNQYEKGIFPDIDLLLPKGNTENLSWYDISEWFAHEKNMTMAEKAHNLAMPNLSDLKSILYNFQTRALFPDLFDIFLTSYEQYIKKYPALCTNSLEPFSFYKKSLYFVFIDIANKDTKNFYQTMIYQHALTHWDDCNAILREEKPVLSQSFEFWYHSLSITQRESFKHVLFSHVDFSQADTFQELIALTAREARKFGMHVIVQSYQTNYLIQKESRSLYYDYVTTYFNVGQDSLSDCIYIDGKKLDYSTHIIAKQNEIPFYFQAYTRFGIIKKILKVKKTK